MNSRSGWWKKVFLSVLIILTVNCAHKQAYHRALELEKSGQYAAAAEQDLAALDKKPDYTEANSHLILIAPLAYDELLARGNNLESGNQWAEAVENWRHLELLLGRFQKYQINLNSVTVHQRLTDARQKGTRYHYQNGGQFLTSHRYQEAILQYRQVLLIDGSYLDTRDKLWESYVRLGDQNLNRGDFENAITCYREALQFNPDTRMTNRMVAEAYYRWAENMMTENNYRAATEKYESALQIDPDYRDAKKRREDAYAKALRRVAILPFRNLTGQHLKYGDILTDRVLNSCIKANLKYATFMDRANLNLILEEHKLAMSGVVDAEKTAEIGKLEGIHYLVTGTITQISLESTPLTAADQTYEKSYSEKDTAGKDILKNRLIRYREYASSRMVQISASYQIVEVETGRYVSGDSYSERVQDEAKWVHYEGNISDLPPEKQKGVNQKKEPRSPEILLSEGFQRVSQKMSDKIIDYFK